MMMVIMCLVWWGQALNALGTDPADDDDWKDAVHDVTWTISRMVTTTPASTSSKRPSEEPEQRSAKKRRTR